ncbi:hypothetical protein JCM11491_006004 [Sporobolomyces phaffii]
MVSAPAVALPRPRPLRPFADSSSSDIANLLTDPASSSAFLPSLPSLSQNTYLPTQLTSLGTAFTSSGTLPRPATPGQKSVAQRRSQAPPLAQTDLRKVTRDEFEQYLAEMAPEYDTWLRESRITHEQEDDDDGDDDRDGGDHSGDEAHGAGGGGGSKLGGSPAKQQQRSSRTRREKRKDRHELEALPPLDQVPGIFFDPAFNLSNPRTFDLVTERIQLTPSSSPALTFSPRLASTTTTTDDELVLPGLGPTTLNELAADQLLQDKLSHFTAVIESHLVREIGLRSSSFFSALSNLQHLHAQGSETLAKIDELKVTLARSDEPGVRGTARHGLEVLRLQARRRGLERIEESVRAVEEIVRALEGVKELVESGEWSDALEVAESIEDAYERSAAASAALATTRPSPSSALAPSPTLPPSPSSPSSRSPPVSTALNLTKLSALKSLPLKLSLIRAQIAKSLEGELISVLEHELDVGIDLRIKRQRRNAAAWDRKGDAEDVREDEDEDENEDDGADRIKERTRPVVKALVRSEGMDSAVQAWRESVLREIRAMVREHLPTSEEGEQDEEDPFASAAVRSVSKQSIDLGTVSDKSLSLAKKLRAMSHEAFLRLAQETYSGLLACIESVDVQSTILLELVSQSRDEERIRKSRRRPDDGSSVPPSPRTSSLAVPGAVESASASSPAVASTTFHDDPAASLSTDIADVLTAVTELANVRFSKVIGVRSEVHAHLALAEFLDVFDATWAFVLRCEVVVKRMIVGLRGAMVSQSKQWLMAFHQKRINESAKAVEEEQWSASEVPRKTQVIVELIVQGAMVDPPELLLGQRRRPRGRGDDVQQPEDSVREDDEVEARPATAKQVDIEGRQFFAVSAGLATVATLAEYLQVVLNCPMLTTDAMSKVVEFMKVFNSRSCQVVLGAGAMRSAGLKNITAKNLALASQALSIMVSLIPYIRELIRRHLNPKQAVMLTEFDKLKRDYQEHQNEIHAKLVAIMSDRLIVHSRTLDTLDWDDGSSTKPGQPNAYMESLVKEHLTLYKVLSRFLHSETVAAIMSQVFKALDSKLGQEYDAIDFQSDDAKERVLVDVKYLQDKLGGLKGLEETDPGKAIEALVLAKSVPPKVEADSAPPSAPPVSDAPAASLLPPRSAVETPLPATPSLWTSLPTSASTSALSLALPDAPSTPRTSLDAPASNYSSPPIPRGRSPSPGPQPPSPVPVPAPLPPSPKPGPVAYKKKSLAERLAERMGRKPVEAVPPQQPPPTTTRDSVELDRSTPSERRRSGSVERDGSLQPSSMVRKDDDHDDERLLEEVQKEIPVWTPKGEKELEEVERQVAREVDAAAEGLGISSAPPLSGTGPETESKPQEGCGTSAGAGKSGVIQEDAEAIETDGSNTASTEEEAHQTSAEHARSDDREHTTAEAIPEAVAPPVDVGIAPSDEAGGNSVIGPRKPDSVGEPLEVSSAADSTPPSAPSVIEPAAPDVAQAAVEEAKDPLPVSEHAAEPSASLPTDEDSLAGEPTTVNVPTEPPTTAKVVEAPIVAPASTPNKPPAISIPATAIPIPPSAPSTPVSSPPPRASPSVTSPSELSSPPSASGAANPLRKKTLKERLAEAARRGSTGSSLVNAPSPPPAPAALPSEPPGSKQAERTPGSNGVASPTDGGVASAGEQSLGSNATAKTEVSKEKEQRTEPAHETHPAVPRGEELEDIPL